MKILKNKFVYIILWCIFMGILIWRQKDLDILIYNENADISKSEDVHITDQSSENMPNEGAVNVSQQNYLSSQSYTESFYAQDRYVSILVDINMRGSDELVSILKCEPRNIKIEELTVWEDALFGKVLSENSLNYVSEIQTVSEVNGKPAQIQMVNKDAEKNYIHSLSFAYLDNTSSESERLHNRLTETQADEMVSDMAMKLGFGDWVIEDKWMSDSEGIMSEKYEQFVYTLVPMYKDMVMFYGDIKHIGDRDGSSTIDYYEHLKITIDNGIVSKIIWNSPSGVRSGEEKFVPLLSYDVLFQELKKYMQVTYTREGFDEILETSDIWHIKKIVVNDAQLKMMCVRDEASKEFLITPVWQFNGDIYFSGIKMEDCLLAVMNAVDGSSMNIVFDY